MGLNTDPTVVTGFPAFVYPFVILIVLMYVFITTFFYYFSRIVTGPRPMDIFVAGFPFRHALGVVFAAVVWWTALISSSNDGEFPIYYYVVLVSVFIVHQVRVMLLFIIIDMVTV